MGEIIIHKDGVFNFFSTVSDGPVFESGLTLKQVRGYIKEEYGNRGLLWLNLRIERAVKHGTSELGATCLEDTIGFNRAGPNETKLSIEEFVDEFLMLREGGAEE